MSGRWGPQTPATPVYPESGIGKNHADAMRGMIDHVVKMLGIEVAVRLQTPGAPIRCGAAYQLRHWPLSGPDGVVDLERLGLEMTPELRTALGDIEAICPGSVLSR